MKQGDTQTLKLTLKTDKLYFVSVQGNTNEGIVQYRIKRIDENQNEVVVYDNSLFDFKENEIFKVDETAQYILEICTQPIYAYQKSERNTDVDVFIAQKDKR